MDSTQKKKRGRPRIKKIADSDSESVKNKTTRTRRGRPKTKKTESVNDESTEKKTTGKRGRKPKPKTGTDKKVLKKRGRKKKETTYSFKKQPTVSYDDPKVDTLILHLPIKSSDLKNELIEDKLLRYNELTEPAPFENNSNFQTLKKVVQIQKDADSFGDFTGIIDNKTLNKKYDRNLELINESKNQNNDYSINDIDVSYTFKENKLVNIRWEFIDANNKHTWPIHTNLCCLWCCHKFDTIPVSLPRYLHDGKFYVSGIFCSFNCAAAYSFSKKDDQVWERYSLLNLMYKKLNECKFAKIRLAPPRETLKMFSGYLSINEFRNSFVRQEKIFKMLEPPIISLIPKVEELISHGNGNNKKLYIPMDENVLANAKKSEKLKLKRNKPVINNTSTLSRFMNLKIK